MFLRAKLHTFIMIVSLAVLSACDGDSAPGVLVGHKQVDNAFVGVINSGYYNFSDNLDITLAFPKNVTVTGLPRIPINIGGTEYNALYVYGDGTKTLTFRHTVALGDLDTDRITVTKTIDLNGGTLKFTDDGSQKNCELDFLLPAGSNGALVDAVIAAVNTVTPPDQVTGLTAAPTTSNTQLAVNWTIPAHNGTAIMNYTVQYREQGTSTWNTASNPTTNQSTINGLSAGITYEIRVAANNELLGPYSAISTAEIFDVMSLNPIAWLSATDITNGGAEPSNNDKIDTWADLTGIATDATKINTNKQPTYQTNVQNGLPAVYFVGTLDRGLSGTFTRTTNNGLTVVLVARYNDTARRAFFEFFKTGGGARGFFFTYGFNNASTPMGLDNTTFNVWSAYDDGTHTDLWENGSVVYTNYAKWGSGVSTAFTGGGSYILGDDQTGGDRLNGWIGEFLIFDGPLRRLNVRP